MNDFTSSPGNIVLSSINLEELTSRISNGIESSVRELIKSIVDSPPKQPLDYLSRREVCTKLRISDPTLWRMQKSGKLHHRKIGRRILFLNSDIESLLTGSK